MMQHDLRNTRVFTYTPKVPEPRVLSLLLSAVLLLWFAPAPLV